MMVSKVAVVALVAILAVPILLGYGFNLSEVTHTTYKNDGESVNVTPLLKNDTAYTNTYADIYAINNNFELYDTKIMPIYSTTTSKTTLPMYYQHYSAGQYPTDSNTFATWTYMFYKNNNDGAGSITYNKIRVADGTIVSSYSDLYTWYWDAKKGTVAWTTMNSAHTSILNSYEFPISDATEYKYSFTVSGDFSCTGYLERNWIYGESTSADIAAGYSFENPINYVESILPGKTNSLTITIDLNSITTTPYYYRYNFLVNTYGTGGAAFYFAHESVNGQNTWSFKDGSTNQTLFDNLYMDPTKSNNTYQLFIELSQIDSYLSGGTTYYHINWHVELRYVGEWPTMIGTANYYMKYETDIIKDTRYNEGIVQINMGDSGQWLQKGLRMRFDSANFAAFAYEIISDKTYTPSDFKTNPTTTLTVSKAGSSIEFGGNTYTVDTKGNITLGTHKVSTNGLKLESLPIAGGYENRINGNVVSVSGTPSTIKFNGQWGASVSTIGNTATTYTKTDWTPGQFGWDGIDDNFLIVGLLTAIGVFIALGIAYRRTKAALGALLVVCGGAIVLFFTML